MVTSDPNLPNLSAGARTMVNQHHRAYQGTDLPLIITVVSPPAHGKVTIGTASVPHRSPEGKVRHRMMTQIFYQSDSNYAGEDSFTYRRVSPDPSDPQNAKTFTMRVRVNRSGPQMQIVEIDATGPWRHKASGMIFPEEVAGFRRAAIQQFLSDGSDIGVHYDLPTPQAEIRMSVYSFPSPALPSDTADMRRQLSFHLAASVVQDIQKAHPDARREESILIHINRNGRRYDGHQTRFAHIAPEFFDRKQEAVKAETYIFSYIGSGWTLKYRFTYPAAADIRAARDRFMDELEWTHGLLN